MRLVQFMAGGARGVAAAGEDGVFHGFTEAQTGYPGTLDAVLQSGGSLTEVGKALLGGPVVDLDKVVLLPPLTAPSKIFCIGLNYHDHTAETGFAPPASPTVFTRFASSLVGHDQPMLKPAASDQFDWEGEMVAVIGKGGRNIATADALDHVCAWSIFNDASVRDWQMRTTQWTLGKNFDGSGPFGPWLVTADAVPEGGKGLTLTTRLNGEVVQQANTSDMIFDVVTQIVTLSAAVTLSPGDIIVTGTPAGVGMGRTPPVWMKVGDICEVEITGLGVLRNRVEQGA